MRTIACLVVLAATLALAACGGTEVRTVVKTVDSSATTPTTTTGADVDVDVDQGDDEASCDEKGINPEVLNEGACREDGRRVVVVNRANELRLRTLAARIDGIRTAKTLSHPDGYASETAHGVFVVVTLTIRNRTNTPQQFSPIGANQTWLLLGERQFSESFAAENGPDPQAFITQSDNTIQPGNSLTGDVIFDVPPSDAKRIDRDGTLFVLNFGASVADSDVDELGDIRLYH